MASTPRKISSPKPPSTDDTDPWRRGAARLIEQGRLMWMLGEGLSAALAKHAQGWVPPDEESLTSEFFGWMQQAWTSGPGRSQREPSIARAASGSPMKKARDNLVPAARSLLKESLYQVSCPVLWVGSGEIEGQWASMALAVGVDGFRRVLGLADGSVREQGVAEELSADLARRGLTGAGGLLVITEGSRTLDLALRQVWGEQVQISHCRSCLREEVLGHFPEASREMRGIELDTAWSLPPDEAAAILKHLERSWTSESPGAAERLGRSREASLVVERLEVPSPLKERLESAGSLRMAFKQSLRWIRRGPAMAALSVGVPAWLQRSRRLVGWQKLELLAHKLISSRPKNNTACAGKTGKVLWAEMPYAEGLATHSGSESCAPTARKRVKRRQGSVQARY